MTRFEAHTAAYAMSQGRYGSFAEHIGHAYIRADIPNKNALIKAFADLFEKVLADITARA